MNMIQLIACVGLITGFFILLRISPMDFTEGVFRRITSKPRSIRAEVNESTRRKKKSFLRREIEDTQNILRMTGRSAKFPMVCALSLLLFLVGAAFALTLGNLFLMPVLAVGMMLVPFWFIRLTANHYKKNIAAEQSSHKTVFAKVPAMGQIWRDFGHAFSFASSSSRGMYPSPSYLIWMCCTRFPLDLSGAST